MENVGGALLVLAIIGVAILALRKRQSGNSALSDIEDLPLTPPPGFTGIIPGAIAFPQNFDLRASVRQYAARTNLDPALVWGIVITESGGDPNAQNPSDPSSGLMQVTPLIGRAFGGIIGDNATVLNRLRDPYVNLTAGTKFLAHLRDRYAATFPIGEWVQAYNVGETLFDKGIRNDLYGDRVLKNSATWKG